MKFFDNIFKRQKAQNLAQNAQNLAFSQNLAQNSQNLRIFRNIHYTNFIFAGFALSAIYALIYALMRVCLIFHTFGDDADFGKFGKAFKMGFVLDVRIVCVVFAVFILLGLLALANKFALAKFKIAKFILLWRGAESSADSANRVSIFC